MVLYVNLNICCSVQQYFLLVDLDMCLCSISLCSYYLFFVLFTLCVSAAALGSSPMSSNLLVLEGIVFCVFIG